MQEFYRKIGGIQSFENVGKIELEYGTYDAETNRAKGGSFQYNFETKELIKSAKPNKEWLDQVKE